MLYRLSALSALALSAAMPATAEPMFNRIASFPVHHNLPEGADVKTETSAEIMSVTEDGMQLIYSDSPNGAIGFVDISDPAQPKPLGSVDVGGEPTTTVARGGVAFVGVNTSENYTNPTGTLRTVDLESHEITASCDLGGQPDSVVMSKDRSRLAVAIENERDEDLGDGGLPQAPAGFLQILPVTDDGVDCAAMQTVTFDGLAEVGGSDPEPEYVAFSPDGTLVVTLQENNHLIVVDTDGKVAKHFSAGTVDLDGIDIEKDGRLDFTGSLSDVPREPDSVTWIDDKHFVTANEGDWKGGSRGFTIFSRDGDVVFDSGNTFERQVVAFGHYNDKRSGKKGSEPEAVLAAMYGDDSLLFVASERGNVIGVYDVSDAANPREIQFLPSGGIGPEGLVAIPERNLFAVANEVDLGEDNGARSQIVLFSRTEDTANWPQIKADGDFGWGALSGLDIAEDGTLYAVSDSVYKAEPSFYKIDANSTPARITERHILSRDGAPAEKIDLEGIAIASDGGFWLASEGKPKKDVPGLVLKTDANGVITQEFAVPDALTDHVERFGFEGIAEIDGKLWIAVQREWKDDPEGHVKLLQLDPATGEWAGVHYPLDTPKKGWIGLSDLAVHGDYLYLIERDNQIGENAETKQITRVKLADLKPAALGGALPVLEKEVVKDLKPELSAQAGFIVDKVEGLAIAADGTAYIVTDNDGVDDSSGETMFFTVDLAD